MNFFERFLLHVFKGQVSTPSISHAAEKLKIFWVLRCELDQINCLLVQVLQCFRFLVASFSLNKLLQNVLDPSAIVEFDSRNYRYASISQAQIVFNEQVNYLFWVFLRFKVPKRILSRVKKAMVKEIEVMLTKLHKAFVMTHKIKAALINHIDKSGFTVRFKAFEL